VAWKVVQHKAAKMVKKMAYEVPELKDKLHLPRRPNNLYHVVSIGSRYICAHGTGATVQASSVTI